MAKFLLKYEEVIDREGGRGKLLSQDFYTTCKRCDTSIPKGVSEYCSVECERGQKKINI